MLGIRIQTIQTRVATYARTLIFDCVNKYSLTDYKVKKKKNEIVKIPSRNGNPNRLEIDFRACALNEYVLLKIM